MAMTDKPDILERLHAMDIALHVAGCQDGYLAVHADVPKAAADEIERLRARIAELTSCDPEPDIMEQLGDLAGYSENTISHIAYRAMNEIERLRAEVNEWRP